MLKQSASKSKEEGVTPADVDPKELAIGKAVEKEHTDSMPKRTRIALDHLAEDPQYYTHPEHIDFEEEAKKESAMRMAHYLVGMKRAFDARGIKFGGTGSLPGLNMYGDLTVIRRTPRFIGNPVTNKNNMKAYQLAHNMRAPGNVGDNNSQQAQPAAPALDDGDTAKIAGKVTGTSTISNATLNTGGWGGVAQGARGSKTPSSKQGPAVGQPDTPAMVAQSEPAVRASNMPMNNAQFRSPSSASGLEQPMTVTACWRKFAQELAGGGSSTSGSAPLYNGVDQKPVTLATPESASIPENTGERPVGNSLFDMFNTRFPNDLGSGDVDADDTEQATANPHKDRQGYSAQQPQGKSFVMESPVMPQVGV